MFEEEYEDEYEEYESEADYADWCVQNAKDEAVLASIEEGENYD